MSWKDNTGEWTCPSSHSNASSSNTHSTSAASFLHQQQYDHTTNNRSNSSYNIHRSNESSDIGAPSSDARSQEHQPFLTAKVRQQTRHLMNNVRSAQHEGSSRERPRVPS